MLSEEFQNLCPRRGTTGAGRGKRGGTLPYSQAALLSPKPLAYTYFPEAVPLAATQPGQGEDKTGIAGAACAFFYNIPRKLLHFTAWPVMGLGEGSSFGTLVELLYYSRAGYSNPQLFCQADIGDFT